MVELADESQGSESLFKDCRPENQRCMKGFLGVPEATLSPATLGITYSTLVRSV